MAEESAHSVLQRLLRAAGEAALDANVTPTRVLRLAMARAAQTSVGLNLTVLGVTEEVMPFDDVLSLVQPEMMLLSLDYRSRPAGFVAVDLQLRTAAVEVQTVGILSPNAAEERRITDADAALCAPLVTEFLSDLARTAIGTPIEGWADDHQATGRFLNTRAISMTLDECSMRLVRLSLDLGGGDRQAEMIVALPAGGLPEKPEPNDKKGGRFDEMLRDTIMEAPASLLAVLHRFRKPLKEIQSFEVGQVLGLPGVTVGSVSLEAPGGQKVAHAKLGQATGLRALRIERPAGTGQMGVEAEMDGFMQPALDGNALPGPDAMALDGAGGFPGIGEGLGGGDMPALDAGPVMSPMGEAPDMAFPDNLPADPPDDFPADLPAELPGELPDGLPAAQMADLPGDFAADPPGDMPDFAAAPMGDGDFGFPAMGEDLPEG